MCLQQVTDKVFLQYENKYRLNINGSHMNNYSFTIRTQKQLSTQESK